MDITLHVVLYPPAQTIDDPLQNAARLRRGDVVNVYLRSEVTEPPVIGGRLAFIHITDVPNVTFEDVKKAISTRLENTYIDGFDAGLSENIIRTDIQRNSLWRIPHANLPQAIKDQLLADQEITVTWTQAKPYIRKKVITSVLDASLDDETTEMVDSDIGA